MSVVRFPQAERLIWTCAHCGCATYYLYSDHTVECAGCQHTSEGGAWVTPIEDGNRFPEKDNAGSISIVAIGSVDLAKRRVLKKIADRAPEAVLIAAWFDDGEMSSWSSAVTKEERDWAVVKLDELAMSLMKRPMPGDPE